MTALQQRRGWFRMAFAAVAFAVLVALVPNQRPGFHRSSSGIVISSASVSSSLAARWTCLDWPAATHATSADYGVLTAILPVLFVGMMASLVFLFAIASTTGLPASAPSSNSLFQRPPPPRAL